MRTIGMPSAPARSINRGTSDQLIRPGARTAWAPASMESPTKSSALVSFSRLLRLSSDLLEDADVGGRCLEARSFRMRPVELEHALHPAGRADDLGLAAGGRGLGAKLEQQGRGAAVEVREPRYVELETGGRRARAGAAPRPRPRSSSESAARRRSAGPSGRPRDRSDRLESRQWRRRTRPSRLRCERRGRQRVLGAIGASDRPPANARRPGTRSIVRTSAYAAARHAAQVTSIVSIQSGDAKSASLGRPSTRRSTTPSTSTWER